MIVEIVFAAGCFWGVEKHFEAMPATDELAAAPVTQAITVEEVDEEQIDGTDVLAAASASAFALAAALPKLLPPFPEEAFLALTEPIRSSVRSLTIGVATKIEE